MKSKGKTIKIVSASGKTYYRPVKASDKNKPAKKLPAVKVAKKVNSKSKNKKKSTPLPITTRLNWNGLHKDYLRLQKEVAELEKQLATKKSTLDMISNRLHEIESMF